MTPDFESIRLYGDRLATREVGDVRLIEHATVLGQRQAIAGIERMLDGMSAGSFREAVIPPHLAYGKAGLGDRVPPNAILRARVWVHDVSSGEQTPAEA